MCDDAVARLVERTLGVKHLPDCPWLATGDVHGCQCAERTFLESCTAEERVAWNQRNQLKVSVPLEVSQTTWTAHRRTA